MLTQGDILVMRAWEPKAILSRLLRGSQRPAVRPVSAVGPPHAVVPVVSALVASAPLELAQRASTSGPRVLLATNDRRFRAVTSALLSQRGYTVLVSGSGHDIAEIALSESVDVVLIDASGSLTDAARAAAKLGSRAPSVGIVAVSADPQTGLATLPLLPKWAPFNTLISAIDRVLDNPNRKRAIGVR